MNEQKETVFNNEYWYHPTQDIHRSEEDLLIVNSMLQDSIKHERNEEHPYFDSNCYLSVDSGRRLTPDRIRQDMVMGLTLED